MSRRTLFQVFQTVYLQLEHLSTNVFSAVPTVPTVPSQYIYNPRDPSGTLALLAPLPPAENGWNSWNSWNTSQNSHQFYHLQRSNFLFQVGSVPSRGAPGRGSAARRGIEGAASRRSDAAKRWRGEAEWRRIGAKTCPLNPKTT